MCVCVHGKDSDRDIPHTEREKRERERRERRERDREKRDRDREKREREMHTYIPYIPYMTQIHA